MQNINYTVGNFVHAYKQAPWRIQLQWVGNFLLGIFGLALVAALYLDITSQAALAGRNIQDMAVQLTVIQHDNADLESKLAEITSTSVMQQRALAMGFQPIDPSQVEYIVVPGYAASKPAILSAMPLRPSAPSEPSEYTQSLLEWLNQRMRISPTTSLVGVVQ